MLDLRQAHFDYDPYPIGLIRPILPQDAYDALASSYPAPELFEFKPQLGNKYSLSELNNPRQYRRFIAENKVWRDFHSYIKGDEFIPSMLKFLAGHNIDLGLKRYWVVSRKPIQRRASALSRVLRYAELSARFEFSMMGADGGHILPHTDSAHKIITLVFSMIRPGEWNPAWGGGTDIVRPKDQRLIYNHVNNYLKFEDVEVLKQWEFSPNQCVLFVKTFNSWHSVSPMQGAGQNGLRKTLTINIENKI